MKVLASHFIDDVDEDLSHIAGLPIQLAFYKRATFRHFDHQRLNQRLDQLNITVESVHAPSTDVYHTHGDEFINTLATIQEQYGVTVITVHPQRGEKRQARSQYRKIEERIKQLGVTIAYETFEAKHEQRKWITQARDMYTYFDAMKQPFLGITYDFTHSEPHHNQQEMRHFHKRIFAVHLSDALSSGPQGENQKHQHFPLGMGDYPVLEFLQCLKDIDYKSYIILEYLPHYRHLLQGDTQLLEQFFTGNEQPFIEEYSRRQKEERLG